MEIDINKMVDKMNNCYSFICRLHNMAPTAELFIEENQQAECSQYLISKEDALKLFMLFFKFLPKEVMYSFSIYYCIETMDYTYNCTYSDDNIKKKYVSSFSKENLRIRMYGEIEELESRDSVIQIEDLAQGFY